jgi:hypothetical protein
MSDASKARENHRDEVKAAHLAVEPAKPSCGNCKHWDNPKPVPGTLQRSGDCIEGPPVPLVVPQAVDPESGAIISQLSWTPRQSLSTYCCSRHKPKAVAAPSMPLT